MTLVIKKSNWITCNRNCLVLVTDLTRQRAATFSKIRLFRRKLSLRWRLINSVAAAKCVPTTSGGPNSNGPSPALNFPLLLSSRSGDGERASAAPRMRYQRPHRPALWPHNRDRSKKRDPIGPRRAALLHPRRCTTALE